MQTDYLTPFLLPRTGIRGCLLTMEKTIHGIVEDRQYPLPIVNILTEMVLGTVCFSSLFKHTGVFTLQSTTDGTIESVVIDVTSDGNVRGIIHFDQEKLKNTPPTQKVFKDLMGDGFITIILDQIHDTMKRYQGIVELRHQDFCDTFTHYLKQSDQIDSYMAVFTSRDELRPHLSGALILQKLPSDSQDDAAEFGDESWNDCVTIAQTLSFDELLHKGLDHQDLIRRLFWQDDPEIYDPKPYQFSCRCSEDRIRHTLEKLSVGDKECLMGEDGLVKVDCEFCKRHYVIQLA